MSDADAQHLADLDAQLTAAGTTGTHVGSLLEDKGDTLLRLGRLPEALAAYEGAARAYAQSPEATNMPVIRAQQAQRKADDVRARLGSTVVAPPG